MSRGMEQTLESLIPLYSSPLPRELVDLARSLLAQSRTIAGSLKPEEEIARTYVCANIACERLKRTLNLPKIQPKPPIPPRGYKKLYDHFEKSLAVRRREAVPTPAKLPGRNTPLAKSNLNTPSKATSTNNTPVVTSTPRFSARKRGLLIDSTEKTVPKWIRPLINALCISLEAPAAAPHVLAGITTILTTPSPSSLLTRASKQTPTTTTTPTTEDKKDKIPALISVLFIFVATKLNGDSTTSEEFTEWRRAVTKGIRKVKAEMMERETKWEWEKWEDFVVKDINEWVKEIDEKGWRQLDWFLNIETGAGVAGGERKIGDVIGDEEEGGGDVRIPGKGGLRARLGTMFQDRVDYLSEENREDYRVWKEGILKRIEEIEAEDAGGDVDIDMDE